MQSRKEPETDRSPASLTDDLLLCRPGDGCDKDWSVSCSLLRFRRLALEGVAVWESRLAAGDSTCSMYCKRGVEKNSSSDLGNFLAYVVEEVLLLVEADLLLHRGPEPLRLDDVGAGRSLRSVVDGGLVDDLKKARIRGAVVRYSDDLGVKGVALPRL